MTMIDSALTRLAGCSADRWLREGGGADFSANFVVNGKFTVSRSPKVKGRLAPRVRGSVYSRSLVFFLPSFLPCPFFPPQRPDCGAFRCSSHDPISEYSIMIVIFGYFRC